jgi:hypothetical protein
MTTHDEDERLFDKLLVKAKEEQLCTRCGYPIGRERAMVESREAGVAILVPLKWRKFCSACK